MTGNNEWLSEEEMPDRNVDGTPMVNGVDLNGRPYGRSAAWEDDPWQIGADCACSPGPLGTPSMNDACHVIAVPASGNSTIPLSNRAHLLVGSDDTLARLRWRCQLLLQRSTERDEVGIQGDAEVTQLDHIESAYTPLDVVHEVLRDAKPCRKVFLPRPVPTPQLTKQLAQALVFDAMDGFAHDRRRWGRSWTLYCRIVFTNLVYLTRIMLGFLGSRAPGERGREKGHHDGVRITGSHDTRDGDRRQRGLQLLMVTSPVPIEENRHGRALDGLGHGAGSCD